MDRYQRTRSSYVQELPGENFRKKGPNKIVVRNLEFPEKGDWISAELDFEAVEKFEKSR